MVAASRGTTALCCFPIRIRFTMRCCARVTRCWLTFTRTRFPTKWALPNRSAIYRKAIEAAQRLPEERFFTDDMPGFVEAARTHGIDAVQFEWLRRFKPNCATRCHADAVTYLVPGAAHRFDPLWRIVHSGGDVGVRSTAVWPAPHSSSRAGTRSAGVRAQAARFSAFWSSCSARRTWRELGFSWRPELQYWRSTTASGRARMAHCRSSPRSGNGCSPSPFVLFALLYLSNSLAPEIEPGWEAYHLGLVYRFFANTVFTGLRRTCTAIFRSAARRILAGQKKLSTILINRSPKNRKLFTGIVLTAKRMVKSSQVGVSTDSRCGKAEDGSG